MKFPPLLIGCLFLSLLATGRTEAAQVRLGVGPGSQFKTLQAALTEAIFQASDPNKSFLIEVEPGPVDYVGPSSPLPAGFSLIIKGLDSARTVIVGSGSSPAFTISGGTGVQIRNFTFKNSQTAIAVTGGDPAIDNNIFESDTTAIKITGGTPTIRNNTFYRNTVGIETGVDTVITNNIFSLNNAAISASITLPKLTYNDFHGTIGVTLPDQTSIPNLHVANADPLFVDPGKDFHLTSDSPARASGNPLYPNQGSTLSDMGVYGGPYQDNVLPAVTGLRVVSVDPAAKTITVDWTKATDSRVTGYTLFYGTASGALSQSLNSDASVTSVTVTGLSFDQPTTPGATTLESPIPVDRGLELRWSAATGATGYRITFAPQPAGAAETVSVGNVTSYRLDGLANGTTYQVTVTPVAERSYFFAVQAVGANGLTSPLSQEQSVAVSPPVLGTPSDARSEFPEAPVPQPDLKNEGCFIATAAYGFYSAPQVQALREFRDRYLMTNAPGRAFVAWYYHYGPRGAHFMNQHPWLKPPVRLALLPFVVGAIFLIYASAAWKLALLSLAAALLGLRHARPRLSPKHPMRTILLLLSLLMVSSAAAAADPEPPRPHWSFDLKGGVVFPAAPGWETSYGQSYAPEFGAGLGYQLTRQLEVGVEGSYQRAEGNTQFIRHAGLASSTKATTEFLPLDLYLLARGIFREKQPVVPYLGGGYTRLFYRQSGGTRGSTNGYHARVGLQYLLDRVDPDAAQELYQEYRVFHTYFFVEGKYRHAAADTVSGGSVNLGGTSLLAGVLVEF